MVFLASHTEEGYAAIPVWFIPTSGTFKAEHCDAVRKQMAMARPLLLLDVVAAVDCGYNQCSRQLYCQPSHRAVAVDHHCPHKAKAALCPLVATQT